MAVEKEVLEVKILMFMMMHCLEEIAKVDEDFQEELEDVEGRVQWKIGDNINAYQIFEDGKYTWAMDAELDDADVTMKVADLKIAKGVLQGNVDSTAAYMNGDVVIEGNLQVVMTYGSLTEFLMDYLQPLLDAAE